MKPIRSAVLLVALVLLAPTACRGGDEASGPAGGATTETPTGTVALPELPALDETDQETVEELAGDAKDVGLRAGCVATVTSIAVRYATRDAGEREETLRTARLVLGEESPTYQAALEVTAEEALLAVAEVGGVLATTLTARKLASGACPKE